MLVKKDPNKQITHSTDHSQHISLTTHITHNTYHSQCQAFCLLSSVGLYIRLNDLRVVVNAYVLNSTATC